VTLWSIGISSVAAQIGISFGNLLCPAIKSQFF
jgi:hypothetical protein